MTKNMKLSARGVVALIAEEGIVTGPYKDSKGIWTCYVGHTKAAGGLDPEKMPRGNAANIDAGIREALKVFRTDIVKYTNEVNAAITVDVAQHVFDGCTSFHYNSGAIGRATFVRSINSGDMEAAARGIMAWCKPPELKPRREGERDMIKHGKYPAKKVNVWSVDQNGKIDWRKPLKSLTPDEVLSILASLEAEELVNELPKVTVTPAKDEPAKETPKEQVLVQSPTPVETVKKPARPVLKMGSKGEAVKELQVLLSNRSLPTGPLDGVFGVYTQEAVRMFQRAHGLVADAIVGEKTWERLLK